MARIEYKLGSSGEPVKEIQMKLKQRLISSFWLPEDGFFGQETERAVMEFQRSEWLIEDGVVEATTWNALMGTEEIWPILHQVPFIAQENDSQCYAACTAMITQSSIPEVINRVPSTLFSEEGLRNYPEYSYQAAYEKMEEFAFAFGLEYQLFSQSLTPAAIYPILAEGPAMVEIPENPRTFFQGEGSEGHWVVLAGIRGGINASGEETLVRVYDPWPSGQGAKRSVIFSRWNDWPGLYRVFWKR